MCSKIDFKSARNIIELGPGTGVFTQEILKLAHPDAKIFVFELNEDFYNLLTENFNDKRLIIIKGSAEKMKTVLNDHGIAEADAILSSLPLAMIPDNIKDNIIDTAYSTLKTEGTFVQYQYSLNAKKCLEKRFGKLKISFSTINIPPAFIYCAVK